MTLNKTKQQLCWQNLDFLEWKTRAVTRYCHSASPHCQRAVRLSYSIVHIVTVRLQLEK